MRDHLPPKILITGADGFLGSQVVGVTRAAGFSVWRLGRNCVGDKSIVADIREPGDWQDQVAAECFDAVFHLAGAPRSGNRDVLEGLHVAGTRHLISALNTKKIWILVASSSGVYGGVSSVHFPITEDYLAAPVGDYATSKLQQEQLALSIGSKSESLGVCVARLSNLIGPGQSRHFLFGHVVGEIANQAQSADSPNLIHVGSLSGTRDFIDVRDAALALLALFNRRADGVFNVATGKETWLRGALTAFLEKVSEKSSLAEDLSGVASPIQRQLLSIKKLTQTTGWVPTISAEESLIGMLHAALEDRSNSLR